MRNGYVSEIGFFRGIVPYLGLGIIDLSLDDIEGWAFAKFWGISLLSSFPLLEFLTQSFKDVSAIKQDNACSLAGTGTV
jgi:hypothetical protein